ncbi:tetraacyldisaccharide 4'-kinase [Tannerella sp.]|uniref:tetraacyldisaccharide 4'-kinase n=1 Tax=Tannerella sp. TaxID=2382127 RepID=UPI0026DCACDD|nr:tetraacyldisaccharide 4'-kinase [Tannerella sp.]MDO4703466.1 tetraacyldisaccharide 4'-kinase [Tannerella sp.]
MAKSNRLYYIGLPVALIYGIAVQIRNLLFHLNILPSQQYAIPVICIGNLSMGGAGKTPLVEYLIRLLSKKYRVAVLSRGYKRQTSGYVLAGEHCTSQEIGDEACQIKRKYPSVIVAVDKSRRRGMKHLLAMTESERPQVVLLDDAFQHRYVQPSLSILVTDYNRLFYNDKLFPVGMLREPAGGVRRADWVVVSKCDPALKPIDCRIMEDDMHLQSHQQVFFSDISYLRMEGIWPEACCARTLSSLRKDEEILLLTGVANPAPLIEEMKKFSQKVKVMSFGDHHDFKKNDVKKISASVAKMNPEAIIVCTEKDAMRIRNNPYFPSEWHSRMYYLPIVVSFLFNKGNLFDELILKHITTMENSRILRQ